MNPHPKREVEYQSRALPSELLKCLKREGKIQKCVFMYSPRQRSTEGQISTAVAEDFVPSATATATEGSYGRRPKFLNTVVKNLKLSFEKK